MIQEKIFSNLLSVLSQHLKVLPDKSEENARNTLCALWHKAGGQSVSPLGAEKLELPILIPPQLSLLDELIESRLSGVPLAHLTQRQNFMDLEFILNEGLYIPRKETELLAKTAITTIANEFPADKSITLLDLCTGIGTVALAVAHICENSRVFGSDIYKPAIDAALINTQHFGLHERATFMHADMFERFDQLGLKGEVDVIVSAPPYISSVKVKALDDEIAQHEPEEAFDAGPFGLDIFNKLIATAPEYLRPNSYLIFECGLGQGAFLAKRLRANKSYDVVTEVCDEYGNVRVLKAKTVG